MDTCLRICSYTVIESYLFLSVPDLEQNQPEMNERPKFAQLDNVTFDISKVLQVLGILICANAIKN